MKCSLINNQQKYILSSFAWFIMLLIYSSCERGESKTTDETIEESWEIIFNGQNLDGSSLPGKKTTHSDGVTNLLPRWKICDLDSL